MIAVFKVSEERPVLDRLHLHLALRDAGGKAGAGSDWSHCCNVEIEKGSTRWHARLRSRPSEDYSERDAVAARRAASQQFRRMEIID